MKSKQNSEIDARLSGFDPRQEREIFLSTTLEPGAYPASCPVGTGALSPRGGVKRRERAAGHSPPSYAKVKNGRSIPPLTS
jgi:hypothetical protein